VELAVAGQTRALSWMATDAQANRLGITIFEVGEVDGPGFGGCPAGAEYADTASDHNPAVNAHNVDQDLVLFCASKDASAISVSLNDEDAATALPCHRRGSGRQPLFVERRANLVGQPAGGEFRWSEG
jgi:hypothetical protein